MAGTKALNSKLLYTEDSGLTHVEVANVTQLTNPQATRADIDMTTLTSTFMEKVKDIPDYGNVSFSFNFDGSNASHAAIIGFQAAGTSIDWVVEMSEPGVATVTTFTFTGVVDGVNIDGSTGGKLEASMDILVDSAVTVAFGATTEG